VVISERILNFFVHFLTDILIESRFPIYATRVLFPVSESIGINFRKFLNLTAYQVIASALSFLSVLSLLTNLSRVTRCLLFTLTRTSRCWRCWRPLWDSSLSRCTLSHPWWRRYPTRVFSAKVQWTFNRHIQRTYTCAMRRRWRRDSNYIVYNREATIRFSPLLRWRRLW